MKKLVFDGRMSFYFIIDAIILVAFVFLPWIVVTSLYSGSALFAPFKLAGILMNPTLMGSLTSSVSGGDLIVNMVCIYTFTWFIIPAFLIIAFMKVFKTGDQEGFIKISRWGMITNLITIVLFFLIRLIAISQFQSALNKVGLGSYGSVTASIMGEAFKPGFGYYVILMCSLIGVFFPAMIQFCIRQGYQIPEGVQGLIEKESNLSSEQLGNVFKSKNIECTGNLLPAITLEGEKNSIKVFDLPCVLGRNKQEVDYYVFDNTISRQHCQMTVYQNKVVIKDFQSTHGTYINNEQIQSGRFYILMDNDLLKLGNLNFRVHFNEILLNNLFQKNNASIQMSQPSRIEEEREEIIAETKFNENVINDNNIPLEIPEEGTMVLQPTNEESLETVQIDYNGGNTTFKPMLLQWINGEPGENDICIMTKTPFYIGKGETGVDYRIVAPGISKRHLSLERINGEYYVTDLNSTNGLKINGDLIPVGIETLLKVGDILDIGEREYCFEDA